MDSEKIRFETNVPVELALKFTDGRDVDSQFGGPQVQFTTTDDRVFYVDPKVAQKLRSLRLAPGELIDICKANVEYSHGRKGIEWQISRVGCPPGQQPDGTFAVPADPPRAARRGRSAGTGGTTPAPDAPAAATPQASHAPADNGHGSTGNGVNGHAYTAGDERPKTMVEDALRTVVSACHSARLHAKVIGYEAMPQFTSEDIRCMANTLMIQRGGGR